MIPTKTATALALLALSMAGCASTLAELRASPPLATIQLRGDTARLGACVLAALEDDAAPVGPSVGRYTLRERPGGRVEILQTSLQPIGPLMADHMPVMEITLVPHGRLVEAAIRRAWAPWPSANPDALRILKTCEEP